MTLAELVQLIISADIPIDVVTTERSLNGEPFHTLATWPVAKLTITLTEPQ